MNSSCKCTTNLREEDLVYPSTSSNVATVGNQDKWGQTTTFYWNTLAYHPKGKQSISLFFADQDYVYYLEYLESLASKFDCAIHAYVLMTNHVHLLLTPEGKTVRHC